VAASLLLAALFSTTTYGQRILPRKRGQSYPVARLGQGSAAGQKKAAMLIEKILEPELQLTLKPTRSKFVTTKLPIRRIAITNPQVMEVTQFSPTQIELIGVNSGETTLTLWFVGPNNANHTLRYLVKVTHDELPDSTAKVEWGRLQSKINELFPNSQIQLIPIADKLVVRGQARDSAEVTQILNLLRQGGSGSSNQNGSSGNLGGGQALEIPGADNLPNYRVVNLLNVPGEQQVMLKVRIAELTRSAVRELGTDFSIVKDSFELAYSVGTTPNITAILDNADLSLFIQAFASNGHGKILAEPTLVTISGKTATFLAGGEFAVPTTVGVGGVGAVSTTFRGFGTQVNFTPTVLDKDRIRLQVASSFSSLNQDNAVSGIPGLNTRAVQTTVDLREGQWLAIAGLIQDEQGGSRGRLPYLGDIPLIGAVFGNQRISRNETELVVLVSPQLVHPMEADQVPLVLPGMGVTEPNDHDFFFRQQIEGDPNCNHRSTIWPVQRERIRQARKAAIQDAKMYKKSQHGFQKHQRYYISGPQGFSK